MLSQMTEAKDKRIAAIRISQKYNEDFGYYHLPYIVNFVNEKIIFGLANSNKAFVHNSIWLNFLLMNN